MNRERDFDNILEECLGRALRGEAIERCLADYPEAADELRPLLETALVVNKAADVKPSPEFRERARYQFRHAIEVRETRKAARHFFLWQPRWATVVASILVVVVTGSGTVMASGNSMPDGPLYPVKLVTEAVQEKLTPSPLGKTELFVTLTDKRVIEIVYLAEKGDAAQVEQATERLNAYLVKVASFGAAQGFASSPKDAQALQSPAAAPRMAAPPVPRPAAGSAAPTVPAPTAGPTPVPAPTPAPSIALPVPTKKSEKATMTAETEREKRDDDEKDERDEERKEKDKIRMKVARIAADHPEILRRAMEKARDESVKSALRRAMESSAEEYEKALKSLD